jgi:hypothetical protein
MAYFHSYVAAAAHSEMILQSARATARRCSGDAHINRNGSAERAIVRDMAAFGQAEKLHRDRLACAAYYFGTQGNFSGNPDADHARTWLATGPATMVAVEPASSLSRARVAQASTAAP